MNKAVKLFTVIAMLLASVAIATTASAHEGPELTPATVDELILPGQSVDIEKTVHTPELPPVLDVCLVVDLSGSYADDLPNIKSLAPNIWDDIVAGGVSDLQMGLASHVDFPFPDWGTTSFPDYAYRLDQQLTATKATWVGAVNGMSTRDGGDAPESQYEALFQVATGAGNDVLAAEPDDVGDIAPGQQCDYREDATKVVMLTTDAPFHNADDGGGPFLYPGASAMDTEDALVDAEIKVIGLKAPGAGFELDALATATGGTTVPTSSTSDDIATAILQALEEISIDVSMASDCAATTGGVIDTTFAPDSQVVEAGEHAVFTETISVAADAPGGIYTCNDWALIDGEPMTDDTGATILETKTILVPENFVTGGGHVTDGKGKDRTSILTFGGNAGYMADGTLLGHWQFNFHEDGVKIHTTEITALQFSDEAGVEPAPPEADADTALMEATARVRIGNDPWLEGCTLVALFQDGGEPEQDVVVSIDVDCGSGVAYFAEVTGGNIQVHDGTKD